MRPVYNAAGFLHSGVPIYEIRNDAGMSDTLIRNTALGAALARTLSDKSVALLRGHGNVIVGPSIPMAVYRAILTETNARLQMQAISLGGTVNYMDPEEGRKIDEAVAAQIGRPWELWKKNAMSK